MCCVVLFSSSCQKKAVRKWTRRSVDDDRRRNFADSVKNGNLVDVLWILVGISGGGAAVDMLLLAAVC